MANSHHRNSPTVLIILLSSVFSFVVVRDSSATRPEIFCKNVASNCASHSGACKLSECYWEDGVNFAATELDD